MAQHNFEFQITGLKLKGQYYEPQRTEAVAILVHGMGEYAKRYERTVVPALLQSAIGVISYDQFGHGNSEGKKGDNPGYKYLLDSIDYMVNKAGNLFKSKPVFLFGHSMGGNVVINYCLRRKNDLTGVIATSPFLRLAFDPPEWKIILGKLLEKIYPSLTMPNELDLQFLSKDPNEIEAYKNDPLIHDRISTRYSLEMMRTGAWAISNAASLKTPMLLLHGLKDQITSSMASEEFALNSNGMASYVPIENGYHELHHDEEKKIVLDRICNWINEQINKS